MKTIYKIQLVLAVLLFIVGGFFVYFIYSSVYKDLNVDIKTENTNTSEEVYRKLDGTLTDVENSNLLPFAIMIENHIDSRPQSGLTEARIVYEVLTEAAITRFLAIYDLSEDVDVIGPVRSARDYFIDIASEYKAVYGHSGGSPSALSILKRTDNVFNLDEFFGYNTGYFFRDSSRLAPHNLYTSKQRLEEVKDHYQLKDDSEFESWKFKDSGSHSNEVVKININYSDTTTHQVEWNYLDQSNKYERSQNLSRHIDSNGQIIEVDNVIVQFANTKIIDSIGRKDIQVIGSGRSIVFRDGLAIEGTWQKDGALNRTRFYDESGQEIELNRGKVWIQIVPNNIEIEF